MSVPSTALFAAGDLVSLERWDATEPPWGKLGVCRVVSVENPARQHCESGVMVTVESKDGKQRKLDSHWLKPYEANK